MSDLDAVEALLDGDLQQKKSVLEASSGSGAAEESSESPTNLVLDLCCCLVISFLVTLHRKLTKESSLARAFGLCLTLTCLPMIHILLLQKESDNREVERQNR